MTRKLEQILSLFGESPDEDYRADLLIEFASRYRLPDENRHPAPYPPEAKVPGCESEVYVFADSLSDDVLTFSFVVQNPQGISAKALAVVLQEGFNGEPLEEIVATSPEFVHQIFGRTLSMGKGQGLMNMINIVRFLARNKIIARASRD